MAGPYSDDGPVSMDDVLRRQSRLEEEAAEVLPFSFSTCTYADASMSEARQPVYSCLTCRPTPNTSDNPAGVCVACSVSCHGDCELVELFSRRDFVCDCGTSRIPSKKCTLTLRLDDTPRPGNKYDDNFDGIFCVCKTKYDPETESRDMIQCLICEDWLHTTGCLTTGVKTVIDEPALNEDAFEDFICEKCAIGPAEACILRYVGRPGFMLLLADGRLTSEIQARPAAAATPQAFAQSVEDPARSPSPISVTSKPVKRTIEEDNALLSSPIVGGKDALPEAKRQKSGTDVRGNDEKAFCTAPPMINEALTGQHILRRDIYLAEGWRERLCICTECLPLYSSMPQLLEEETTYEPPEDTDAHKSLFDLGTAALQQMPREQAVKGLEAYSSMRDKLRAYLEPFAREGKVVQESDIQQFFEEERRKRAELARA